ncbi:MAG: patatin-like phospholipase family protein [Planctomycetota bacterium]
MRSTPRSSVVALWSAALACLTAAAGCGGADRPAMTDAEFQEAMSDFDTAVRFELAGIYAGAVRGVEAEFERVQAGEVDEAVVDVLMISSGGADGAFGAGFLQGWAEAEDPAWRRPVFDRVTGVSAGALTAPFAFVGTDEAYARIAEVFANPQPDWASGSALGSVLTDDEALFNNDGLRTLIEDEIDDEMLAAIAEGQSQGRALLVGATNLDLSRFRVFDLTQSARVGREELIEKALLASASIPGVFPPVEIDGWYYGDGGVVANLFLGVDRDLLWRREPGPWWDAEAGLPPVRIRHWVIVNGKVDPPPLTSAGQRIPRSWSSLGRRALSQMLVASNVRALQQLDLESRFNQGRADIRHEFYWVCIPADAELPEESGDLFDAAYMRALLELGREMGKDPGSWRTESPRQVLSTGG